MSLSLFLLFGLPALLLLFATGRAAPVLPRRRGGDPVAAAIRLRRR